jgi:hypothetical protein
MLVSCPVQPTGSHEETLMMLGWTMGLEGWLWMGAWILALAVLA